MTMLILKALHLVFAISWFAGLFYLPRLFVNHALTRHLASHALLCQMERKLYRFMSVLAILTLSLGVGLLWLSPPAGGWLHAKLAVILALCAYHLYCGRLLRLFREERNQRSHVWYRWFNEIPVLALCLIIFLAVLKPF